MEVIFEVREAEEGGFTARALGFSIFTDGDSWDELRANVREATALHLEEEAVKPKVILLRFIKEELIPFEPA
jgi:predicted RNase H-like HicB family nuclease